MTIECKKCVDRCKTLNSILIEEKQHNCAEDCKTKCGPEELGEALSCHPPKWRDIKIPMGSWRAASIWGPGYEREMLKQKMESASENICKIPDKAILLTGDYKEGFEEPWFNVIFRKSNEQGQFFNGETVHVQINSLGEDNPNVRLDLLSFEGSGLIRSVEVPRSEIEGRGFNFSRVGCNVKSERDFNYRSDFESYLKRTNPYEGRELGEDLKNYLWQFVVQEGEFAATIP